MGNFSLPIRFAILFSLSLSAASSSPSSLFPSSLSLFRTSSPSPKATAGDLLSLLGPKEHSSKLNPTVAHQLSSCLRFLVPFRRSSIDSEIDDWSFKRRSTMGNCNRQWRRAEEEENELIWWPPVAVMELARLAFDSGGDPDAVHRTLDPAVFPVPDIEGSKECKCELTRTPYGWRFINEELNSYIIFLFEMIASRGPSVGLNVSLSRYDLFHGHLFLAKDSGRLGILFHAREYPAYEKEVFPVNMGYCQTGSDVVYDDTMNLRNILWLAPLPSDSSKAWVSPGVLVILDANPEGIIYRDLIPEYVQFARTIYEDEFGEVAVDVNYLNVGGTTSNYQLFIC